jgi:uncharacterized protein (DUF342 family)
MLDLDCLSLSQDKHAALIHIYKPDHLVSASEVRALIYRSDFSEFEIDDDAVNQAVEQFSVLYQEDSSAPDKAQSIRLAFKKNAEIHIDVSEDKMSATATIIAAAGGEHIGQVKLIEALREAKVSFGLQTQETLKFLAKTHHAEPKSKWVKVIALGRPPEHGFDSQFKRLVQTAKERLLQPQKIDANRVDMRDLGELATVKLGTPIMRRIPHFIGRAGKNVHGETIANAEGKVLPLTIGDGTQIDDKDPDLLIANAIGLPIEIENGMRIDDVFTLKNVDVTTGHIDFTGSVIVKGDVQSGMQIRAAGDIHINGFAESCHLEAGGDIVVNQGIIGQRLKDENQFSCELYAKGTIHTKNAQYCHLVAEGEITVTSQLNHCYVKTNSNLTVADQGGSRGLIVGSHIEVGSTVETITLGTPAGSPTYIAMTGDYQELLKQTRALDAEIEDIHLKINEVIDAQLKLVAIANDEKREALRDRLDKTLTHYQNELTKVAHASEKTQQRLQAYLANAKLIVKKNMYSNIQLDIAGQSVTSARQYGPTKSKLEGYTLSFEPL